MSSGISGVTKTGSSEIPDDQILQIIKKNISKRKDTASAYKSANRIDLAEKEELEAKFDKQIEALEVETNMQYITGIERRALDKGREEGREEGRRDTAVRLLLRLLNHRFAQLPADLPEFGRDRLKFSRSSCESWI